MHFLIGALLPLVSFFRKTCDLTTLLCLMPIAFHKICSRGTFEKAGIGAINKINARGIPRYSKLLKKDYQLLPTPGRILPTRQYVQLPPKRALRRIRRLSVVYSQGAAANVITALTLMRFFYGVAEPGVLDTPPRG